MSVADCRPTDSMFSNLKEGTQLMAIYTPYTYLIGWSLLQKWYYGARYARISSCLYETGCHPDDFFVTYFTSSVVVKQIIEKHGIPDVIQIRKTFPANTETPSDEEISKVTNAARMWEHKVLKRIQAVKRQDFLNRTDNAGPKVINGQKRPGVGGRKPGCKSNIKGKIACHNTITLKLKYVNNVDRIPEGFVFGGPPKTKKHNLKNSLANKGRKFADDTKERWSRIRRGKNLNGNNPNAKQITIRGVTYSSKKEAYAALGISKYILNKMIENETYL